MIKTILSSRGEPFKLERHAQAAVEACPGFIVVEDGFGGFIGIKEAQDTSFPEPNTGEPFNPQDITCPGCGQCFHETTSSFDSDKDANPAMLRLKEPWLGWGWDAPPLDPTMGYGCLVCPDCGSALAPNGRFKT